MLSLVALNAIPTQFYSIHHRPALLNKHRWNARSLREITRCKTPRKRITQRCSTVRTPNNKHSLNHILMITYCELFLETIISQSQCQRLPQREGENNAESLPLRASRKATASLRRRSLRDSWRRPALSHGIQRLKTRLEESGFFRR